MDYSRFFTQSCISRGISPIRKLGGMTFASDVINFAGGLPNVDTFPFVGCEVTLRNGERIKMSDNELGAALQYGPSQGHIPLLKWLTDLQLLVHNPPTAGKPHAEGGLDLIITCGSLEGITKSFEMLIRKGDNVLVENPTFPGTLASVKAYQPNLIAVDTDHDGMKPESLRDVLSPWKPEDAKDPKSGIPRILYTVPTGGNPTGSVMTYERKKEVYKIAQEYNILILEDDPYFFLHYGEEKHPSYLSLDTDGRVLRFDSFSKVLSAGLRIGFVTGPYPLVQSILVNNMSSSIHTSMLGQVLVCNLLERWGIDGFNKHVDFVSGFYKKRRNLITAAADKHLKNICEWGVPKAGMFLWIKIIGLKSTLFTDERKLEKKVLVIPGYCFYTNEQDCPYFRVSFSKETPENIDEGMARLAEMIREELEKISSQ